MGETKGFSERTKRSVKNVIAGLSSQLIIVALGFVARRIFINTLGLEILGVNGLLTSIISMLSLSELGIGTAVICSLYKPLEEGDRQKVTALVQFFARSYRAVGLIVLALGLGVTPFLGVLPVSGMSPGFLSAVFLLFLADTAVPYFFAHKRALIFADQNSYILTAVGACVAIAANLAQIALLLTTHNYLLYLGVRAVLRLAESFIISKIANLRYSYITHAKRAFIDAETKKSIISGTKALALHYSGIYLINGTDNLIIYGFLGAAAVGMYSNYYLIIATLVSFLAQMQSGVTASFGNLAATQEMDKAYLAFKNASFINFAVCNFAAVSLLCLLNPFIALWAGYEALLPFHIAAILSLNFYITGISGVLGSIRAGAGLFRPDMFLHPLLAALNLVVSILLVKHLGMAGVFIGTLLCLIIKEVSVLPRIVYKGIIGAQVSGYYKKLALYILTTFCCAAVTYFVCEAVAPDYGLTEFLIRLTVCIIIPNAVVLLLFRKTEGFKFTIRLAASVKAGLVSKQKRS